MNVELAIASANEIRRFKPVVARNEMMLTNLEGVLNGTGDQMAFITHRQELEDAIRLLNKFYGIGLKTTNARTNFKTEQAEERNEAMTKVYNAVRNGMDGKYDRQYLENMIIKERHLNAMDRSILAKMNEALEHAIGDADVQALDSQFKAMGLSPCSSYRKNDCPPDRCTFYNRRCREPDEVNRLNDDSERLYKLRQDMLKRTERSSSPRLETPFSAAFQHKYVDPNLNISDIHPNASAEDHTATAIQDLQRRLTACMIDIGDIALKLKPFYSNEERKTAFDNKVKECSHIPKQLLFETERVGGDQGVSIDDIVMKLQKDLDDVIETIDDLLEKWTSTGLDTRRTTLYMSSKKAIDIIGEIELKIGQRRYILNETASESEMEIDESLNKRKILLGDLYNVCVGEIGTVFASENIRQEELRNKAEAVVMHFFET